jgi:hypothetical protein
MDGLRCDRQTTSSLLRNASYDECQAHVTIKYVLNTIITARGQRGKCGALCTLPLNAITCVRHHSAANVNELLYCHNNLEKKTGLLRLKLKLFWGNS